MSNEIQVVKKETIVKLKKAMELGFSASQMEGFERAFEVSGAIMMLEKALTNEVMKPIMALQGSRLGFRTDKDSKGGYEMPVVKRCMIEAVLTGVQPVMNQFNIIANNMYVTKEGCSELLSKIEGLTYSFISFPPVALEKTKASVKTLLKWNYNGIDSSQELEFHLALQYSQYDKLITTPDALSGKSERKSKMWLYNHITGNTLTDGEANPEQKLSNAEEVEAEIETKANTIKIGDIDVDENSGEIIEKQNADNDIEGQQKMFDGQLPEGMKV